MFREIGSTDGVSELVGNLGHVYLRLGRYEDAARNLEQALATFRQIGDRILQASALNGLGEVLIRTGETQQACVRHAAALMLASETRVPWVQARAHSGLAAACQADGDLVQARHHWQEALTRYAAIGAPEADEIRARLAMADGDPLNCDAATT